MEKQIEDDLIKKLEEYCSPFVVESLKFLRALLLLRVAEKENVESTNQEPREALLKLSEDSIRAQLKNLMAFEEVKYLQNEIAIESAKEFERKDDEIARMQEDLSKAVEKTGFNKESKILSNQEEDMCYADQRC